MPVEAGLTFPLTPTLSPRGRGSEIFLFPPLPLAGEGWGEGT